VEVVQLTQQVAQLELVGHAVLEGEVAHRGQELGGTVVRHGDAEGQRVPVLVVGDLESLRAAQRRGA
jgi:hypothetical protein